MERRVNRLQGEKNNDEQVDLERRIDELKKSKEEKRNQFDLLLIQYKRVEDESRKSKRGIDELVKDKSYIDSKIAELTLHIDTAQRLLEKIVVTKSVSCFYFQKSVFQISTSLVIVHENLRNN